MPLVAHNQLPSFKRLQEEGIRVLAPDFALHQDIRELHIGLLNMMPDAALAATERQFFRLVGDSNPIAQFYVHPFTLAEIPRSKQAQSYIDQYYESFDSIREKGLDGLIITGANVIGAELSNQTFWQPLKEVIDWAYENVTSTLCSCLATHAVLEFSYHQQRQPQADKIWGVFPHRVVDKLHPLTDGINTRFDVPHSRWNSVTAEQFERAKLKILVQSESHHVHLATSADGFRQVFFQGHPEYDTISLLKEYKREVSLYIKGERADYPPFPENYFSDYVQAILNEYRYKVHQDGQVVKELAEFPESQLLPYLDNSWHDSAGAVVGKWVGLIYQVTNSDRSKPFMDDVNPDNPLAI